MIKSQISTLNFADLPDLNLLSAAGSELVEVGLNPSARMAIRELYLSGQKVSKVDF